MSFFSRSRPKLDLIRSSSASTGFLNLSNLLLMRNRDRYDSRSSGTFSFIPHEYKVPTPQIRIFKTMVGPSRDQIISPLGWPNVPEDDVGLRPSCDEIT